MSTTGDKKYLLDANVLINAHRSYYGFDICPGFWKSILAGHAAGKIFSTARVKDELSRGKDLLTDWLKADLPTSFFLNDSTLFIAAEFGPMMQWVQSKEYTPAAKSRFASDADGWIIATAKQGNYQVVTHEANNDDAKKRVMMPTVCKQFGVDYCNTFEMLRDLKCCYQ